MDIDTELTTYLEQDFIKLIKRADNDPTDLTMNDMAMLFYWVRHRDEQKFARVNAAVGYGKINRRRKYTKGKGKKKNEPK